MQIHKEKFGELNGEEFLGLFDNLTQRELEVRHVFYTFVLYKLLNIIMKRSILLLITFIYGIAAFSQYDASNSIMRQAFIVYEVDARGFYSPRTNAMLSKVDNITQVYGYDKKAQNLYVLTTTSNVVITLTKEYAKIIKKNRNIPQLKDEEIDALVMRYNNSLADKFKKLNIQRQHTLDSIRTKEIADSIARVRADSIAKAKRDSIERARQEKLRQAELAKQKKAEIYRSNHSWHWLPIGQHYLNCDLCDENVSGRDSILIRDIRNDSITFITYKSGYIDEGYIMMHRTKIPNKLKQNKAFAYHCEVYSDSLISLPFYNREDIDFFNSLTVSRYYDNLKKVAPYGFFLDWSWDNEYSMVTMKFRYMNLNKKTIKYIDVYWRITNDVNDVRGTGHFKGTGPLAQFESASWDWDSSHYFISGDASNMNITKVILTYMDGTQKVLTGKAIRFD